MKNHIVLLSIAILASGCATRPGGIKAVDYPADAYQQKDCQSLVDERGAIIRKLTDLNYEQNRAADNDAFGVFLIGVPVSSLTGGDKETDIAVTKGQLAAIENVIFKKSCGGVAPKQVPVKPGQK